MIIGGCPYCDASQWNPYAGPGKMEKIECDACHKTYYLQHSNIDPKAFTAEEFGERFIVDEVTRTLVDKVAQEQQKARDANPALAKALDALAEKAAKDAAAAYVDGLLYGFPDEAERPSSSGGLADLLKLR